MTAAKHTPGPWHSDGLRIYAPTDSVDMRDGRVIVDYKHREDFNPADAPLIAAAPELLASVRMLMTAIENIGGEHVTGLEGINCVMDTAQAVIARATGAEQ